MKISEVKVDPRIKDKWDEAVKCATKDQINKFENRKKRQEISFTPKYMRNIDPFEHLKEYGWCVINVNEYRQKLDKIDFDIIEDKFLNWLENYKGFKRDDEKTWTWENVIPDTNFNGIFNFCFSHEDFVWDVRKSVYPIFKDLWNDEDLLSSYDGGNFIFGNHFKKAVNWLHTDRIRFDTVQNYQGLVTINDCGEKDGGLLVVEESHKYYDSYMKKNVLYGYGAGLDLEDEDMSKLEIVKPCGNKGDLILWDNKTFHANAFPESNKCRMAIYVSMGPRKYATNEELEQRKQMYLNKQGSGHWTCGYHFKVKHEYDESLKPHKDFIPKNEEPKDKLIRQMVGY